MPFITVKLGKSSKAITDEIAVHKSGGIRIPKSYVPQDTSFISIVHDEEAKRIGFVFHNEPTEDATAVYRPEGPTIALSSGLVSRIVGSDKASRRFPIIQEDDEPGMLIIHYGE